MVEPDDIKFMRRCLELASKAEGMTFPNPLVGSVIVHDGRIIGEGYHLKSGSPHAEVNAINSVRDKSLLDSSTLYVNLEPCSHYGKTPPCSDYIISNKIPRVVVGTVDTSEKVSGKGISKLSVAGCQVISGVLEKECRFLNKRFFTFHEQKRPYITLKWAQSADSYLDLIRDKDYKIGPNWITGLAEKSLVHKWRASEQAILVGAGTIRADNPKLNVREWSGNNPVKIILSNSGLMDWNLVFQDSDTKVIVFTSNIDVDMNEAVRVQLKENIPASQQICDYLYAEGIQSLFIEGGAKVLTHFILTGLWDEARIFTGETFFKNGVAAPSLSGTQISRSVFSNSTLQIYTRDLS